MRISHFMMNLNSESSDEEFPSNAVSNSGLRKIRSHVITDSSSESSDEEFPSVPAIEPLSPLILETENDDVIPLTDDEAADSSAGIVQNDHGTEQNSNHNTVVLVSDGEAEVAECSNENADSEVKSDIFRRASKRKYTMDEKYPLGKLVVEKKKVYDNLKKPGPQDGYLAKAVREFFSDLTDAKNSDPLFSKALKLAKRCYNDAISGTDPLMNNTSQKKARKPGGGRKLRVQSVRNDVFEWFVDVRSALKSRMPKKLFLLKCQQVYSVWLGQQSVEVQAEHQKQPMQFSNKWLQTWCRDFHVSLKHPNKRYKIKQEDRKERIEEYIKNIWRIRYYFIKNFGKDPAIINGDQMPLHRNEQSNEKTLSFKGVDCYVKENYMLSRERVTAYTQVSSDPNQRFKPEFVFKGKGTRTHLENPDNIHYQFAPKGSYRLENMLTTIEHLPNRFNYFSHENYQIYSLDDYAVHLEPPVQESLLKRGYIYAGIGGGITGDIQLNDTDMHAPLKKKYRHLEADLMLQQLQDDPSKIPRPSKDDMMSMLNKAWSETLEEVNVADRYKCLWLTNNLDGSEDYLVSERIKDLVGEPLLKFRRKLVTKEAPKTLKALLRTITPPKGVQRKQLEGEELIDCEGEELEENEDEEEDVQEDDTDQEQEADGHGNGNEETNEVGDKEGSLDDTDRFQAIDGGREQEGHPLTEELTEDEAKDEVVVIQFPHLRQDYRALQDLKQMIIKHQDNTSRLFLPTMMKLQQAYREGRGSLRRRMVSCASAQSDMVENVEGNLMEQGDNIMTENAPTEDENHSEMDDNDNMQILFISDSEVLENIVLV